MVRSPAGSHDPRGMLEHRQCRLCHLRRPGARHGLREHCAPLQLERPRGRRREALELTNLYYQRVEECFQRLLQRPFGDNDFTTLAQRLYPDQPKKDGGTLDRSAARAKLTRLFHEGKGMDHPEVKNTRWAAYNAVTEYVDHYWRYQKGKYGGPEDVRMNHVIWGQGRSVEKAGPGNAQCGLIHLGIGRGHKALPLGRSGI